MREGKFCCLPLNFFQHANCLEKERSGSAHTGSKIGRGRWFSLVWDVAGCFSGSILTRLFLWAVAYWKVWASKGAKSMELRSMHVIMVKPMACIRRLWRPCYNQHLAIFVISSNLPSSKQSLAIGWFISVGLWVWKHDKKKSNFGLGLKGWIKFTEFLEL